MAAPLYEHLKNYAAQNRISFAMPGHKNGRGLRSGLVSLDVTELPATENLYHGSEHMQKANALLSSLYGSDESFILTGGSTAAIQAMICGAVKKGGVLLASGDCHVSVINACALLGVKIRFFPKDLDAEFGVPAATETVKDFLTPDVDAVIVTSPNYYGVCSDIKKIADECHDASLPLLVDEAHGAHFAAYDIFPETAVKYADTVCHSAHKTLNAMNGAAYLHLNGTLIDRARAKRALTIFQSTSPSYVIAATADTARDELKNVGWDRTYRMCMNFRDAAAKAGIRVLDNDDKTRLVINFSDYYITGFEVRDILSENGIDIEMADLFNIVAIVTPSNTLEEMRLLWWNILEIAEKAEKKDVNIGTLPPPACEETLDPSRVFAHEWEEVELERAAGRIACDTVVPYPPGVPVIFTGERIRREQIEYVSRIAEAGGEVNGIEDGKILVVK